MTLSYDFPAVRPLNDREWELVRPFIYTWEDGFTSYCITIPLGFAFDGASVPRIVWTLTGLIPTGAYLGAAAVHDYCYQRRGRLLRGEVRRLNDGHEWEPIAVDWDRRQCDRLFLLIMQDGKVPGWKSKTMYRAVRLFGWRAWNQ